MFNFYLIFLMLFSSIATHSAYIDTRDMSTESARIQRALGQLDALNISPSRNSPSMGSPKVAMLAMMTMGLAVATTSSSYRRYGYAPPVKTYHKPYYYHRPRVPKTRSDKNAEIVGATMITLGAIALAAAEAAEQEKQQREELLEKQRQETLQKLEIEINSIISNLVSTDTDFISDNKTLDEELSYTADKSILEIAKTTSNKIQLLLDHQEKMRTDFVDSTNRIASELFEFEKHITEGITYNIHMMDGSVKDRELKNLNKTLENNMIAKQKDAKKQTDKLIKDFNRDFPKTQEKDNLTIEKLKESQNESILKEVENIATKKSELFQIYIDKYIQKLAAY